MNDHMSDDESRIDAILMLMNGECEERGVSDVSHIRFDFSNPIEDTHIQDFISNNNCDIEEFYRTLRRCKTRKFIQHTCMGSKEFSNLSLTKTGQARAISAKNGRKIYSESASPVNIGIVNIQGAGQTQIGNNNTINIQKSVHDELLKIIESSTASIEDKKEAKSFLAKFFENPSVAAVFGSVSGTIGNILKG